MPLASKPRFAYVHERKEPLFSLAKGSKKSRDKDLAPFPAPLFT
jgi:hypothetical protein